MVYAFFSGDFFGSYSWVAVGKEATVGGDIDVEVQPSDWMMQKDKSLTLKNPTVEIYVDGKRVQKHKMQAEVADTNFTRYTSVSYTHLIYRYKRQKHQGNSVRGDSAGDLSRWGAVYSGGDSQNGEISGGAGQAELSGAGV